MGAFAKAVCGAATLLALLLGSHSAAIAAGDAAVPPSQDWSFDGWSGTVDRAAAQRGLQIYLENCSGCHSLSLVSYRNLGALGFSEDEIKAIAETYFVTDGPDDFGDMFERPALPSASRPVPRRAFGRRLSAPIPRCCSASVPSARSCRAAA